MKENHKHIVEQQRKSEREQERYNQIFNVVTEIKITVADLSKSFNLIAIQLAQNDIMTGENTRRRWGTKEILSLCFGGVMVIMALSELIIKLKQ